MIEEIVQSSQVRIACRLLAAILGCIIIVVVVDLFAELANLDVVPISHHDFIPAWQSLRYFRPFLAVMSDEVKNHIILRLGEFHSFLIGIRELICVSCHAHAA